MYRVLIVDDDKLARRGIISMMPWDKYQMSVVGEAQNGEQALEFLTENVVDVVFADIDMPAMDGITLMKKCSQLYPELLFVVLTFYEDFQYVQSALRMGAIDYISKLQMEAVDCDQLLEQISKKIENSIAKHSGTHEAGQAAEEQNKSAGQTVPVHNEREWQLLVKSWKEMYWLYDDTVFEQLCRKTMEIGTSVRRIEHALLPLARQAEESAGMAEKDILEYYKPQDFLQWLKSLREGLYQMAARETKLERIPVCIMKSVMYVKEHLGEQLHAEETALQINLSRSYFSVNFKKYVGISFKEFVRQERVKAAKKLLSGQKVLVADIAPAVGYEDVNYFIRVFFELTGMTPGEYKKLNCKSGKA